MTQLNIGVVFGGRSVEHEVSVISALQAMSAMPSDRFRPVPLYIAKDGRWFTGDVLRELPRYQDLASLLAAAQPVVLSPDASRGGLLLSTGDSSTPRRGGLFARGGGDAPPAMPRIDVVFPLIHGSHGEDGTLQGLCELADVAYCGSGVTASALSMDKPLAKAVWRSAGIPVLDDVVCSRARWRRDPDGVLADVGTRLGYPVYVKPATLGSSIGVARAADAPEARAALDVAAVYCDRLIVEPSQDDIVEVNCSVLGRDDEVRASVCEQPLASGAVLSYEDKYRGGAKGTKGADAAPSKGMQSTRRIIPAPLPDALTERIRDAACRSFIALGCSGVARIDFLVRPEQEWFAVNELNSIPGSLSFYLWEPAGLPFDRLLAEIVDLGIARHTEKRQSTFSFDSWLLTASGIGGVKGTGGS